MHSGVGEAKALRNLGIDVVENLPGVGVNLQDHVLLSGVVFKYKGKMPDRPADSNAVEAEAYLSSSPSGDKTQFERFRAVRVRLGVVAEPPSGQLPN